MPANSTSKLVPPETQSDADVQWFQAISANMNAEAQNRALAASRKAGSSVFTNVGDDEASLIAVQAAPV